LQPPYSRGQGAAANPLDKTKMRLSCQSHVTRDSSGPATLAISVGLQQ